jgi:hypothetical protein
MTTPQIVVLELCAGSIVSGLVCLIYSHDPAALFFAVLAVAFAVLFDGLREYKR